MLPVGVDDQRVQAGLGGRPIGRRYPFKAGLERNLWLLDREVIIRQVNGAEFDSGGHASACGAVASSQSTSPSASAGLPTSIVAPRFSAPGFRFSRHTM